MAFMMPVTPTMLIGLPDIYVMQYIGDSGMMPRIFFVIFVYFFLIPVSKIF